MQIKIRTSDAAFAAHHGGIDADGFAAVTVENVEHLTFAGRECVRFDLRTVDTWIPRDWHNPWALLPAVFVVDHAAA